MTITFTLCIIIIATVSTEVITETILELTGDSNGLIIGTSVTAALILMLALAIFIYGSIKLRKSCYPRHKKEDHQK